MVRLVCGFVFACVFHIICIVNAMACNYFESFPSAETSPIYALPLFFSCLQSLQGFFNEVSGFSMFSTVPQHLPTLFPSFPTPTAGLAWPPGARARSWPLPAVPPAQSGDLQGESCDRCI